jgi:hypothetical protein
MLPPNDLSDVLALCLMRSVSNILLTQLDLLLPYGPTGQQRRKLGGTHKLL